MKVFWVFLFLFPFNSCFSQDWIMYFGYGYQGIGEYCIEQYDHGYILLGYIGNPHNGWIVKTDINGNQMWDLKIGDGIHSTMPRNIEQTKDNGFILCGSSTMFNPPSSDPFIMKLNSCGNIEWCRGLVYDNSFNDAGISVKQTSDGGYVLLGLLFGNDPNDRIRLFKFDSTGNLQWHKVYNRSSRINSEDVQSLCVDDSTILITESAYTPNWLRPYYIQTDTAGNENWRLIYSLHTDSSFVGEAWTTVKDRHGNYYSSGRRSAYPELLKFSSLGQEMMNTDLFPNAISGRSLCIVLYQDTNCIIGAGWDLSGNDKHDGLVKTDTLGLIRKTITFPLDPDNTAVYGIAKTFDDKIIAILTNYLYSSYRMALIKVNGELQYDSIYTRHFTYDSLCPHSILSDTIVPSCVVVGIDEPFQKPETSSLKVFPNPASNNLTVEFPNHLIIKNANSLFGSTTVYEKWKSTLLEVYDLSGKRVFQKEIIRSETSLQMDVSSWQRGIYYFKLSFKRQTVAGEKVMIR